MTCSKNAERAFCIAGLQLGTISQVILNRETEIRATIRLGLTLETLFQHIISILTAFISLRPLDLFQLQTLLSRLVHQIRPSFYIDSHVCLWQPKLYHLWRYSICHLLQCALLILFTSQRSANNPRQIIICIRRHTGQNVQIAVRDCQHAFQISNRQGCHMRTYDFLHLVTFKTVLTYFRVTL